MEVVVEQDLCISCGDCIDICPEIFDWNEEGFSQAKAGAVPSELEPKCQEAIESCPTEAIRKMP